MLISRQAKSGSYRRQGMPRMNLAELRRQLADPSAISDGHKGRLLDLARRLARVRALGGEYARVGLSESAEAALNGQTVTA